jgi:hypothetical protein
LDILTLHIGVTRLENIEVLSVGGILGVSAHQEGIF